MIEEKMKKWVAVIIDVSILMSKYQVSKCKFGSYLEPIRKNLSYFYHYFCLLPIVPNHFFGNFIVILANLGLRIWHAHPFYPSILSHPHHWPSCWNEGEIYANIGDLEEIGVDPNEKENSLSKHVDFISKVLPKYHRISHLDRIWNGFGSALERLNIWLFGHLDGKSLMEPPTGGTHWKFSNGREPRKTRI